MESHRARVQEPLVGLDQVFGGGDGHRDQVRAAQQSTRFDSLSRLCPLDVTVVFYV